MNMTGGEVAIDSVQAHLSWRVCLAEAQAAVGRHKSHTLTTWLWGQTIDWQIWVNLVEGEEMKIFVVPLSHTLTGDPDREVQCSVFFRSRYSEIFMKSFTKRLGPWLGRGEGIAFSEKTLKNMTDADNSLGIVVDLVIPAQVNPIECEARQELSQHLSSLSRDSEFTDLVLRCQDRTFPCHKAVLAARSPVLRALLLSDMRENNLGEIHIQDSDPESVQVMLDHLYTGVLPTLTNGDLDSLLHLAVKYHLTSLTLHLERELTRWAPSLQCLLRHLVLSYLYLPLSPTHNTLLQAARERPKVCEVQEWGEVVAGYPSLVEQIIHNQKQE